jgi:hypothetical protein
VIALYGFRFLALLAKCREDKAMTNGQTTYTLPGGAPHYARLLHTRIGIGGVAEMATASDTETGRGTGGEKRSPVLPEFSIEARLASLKGPPISNSLTLALARGFVPRPGPIGSHNTREPAAAGSRLNFAFFSAV